MRKFFLPLLYAIMLGGCAKHGGLTTNFILENKELTALKGRHILDMQKYIDRWAKIEIGMLSNKYYLQYDPQVLPTAISTSPPTRTAMSPTIPRTATT